jgi:putative MATE family efflux protein
MYRTLAISLLLTVLCFEVISSLHTPHNSIRAVPHRPRHRFQGHGHARNTRLRQSDVVTAALDKAERGGPKILRGMPQGDSLDKRILALALPAIVNFAILPLVGAVDTAFVGQMGDALALAGQGAANQVFSSTFWIISFLPSVITPLVAQAVGSGNQEEVQDRVGEAMFLAVILGLIGSVFLGNFPAQALSTVLPGDAPAMKYAKPYLAIRALTFVPAILSTVGFSCFRGSMDIMTPLKISLVSNLVNIVLDPLFIFRFGMGVSGAALATCMSEIVGFVLYTNQLLKKRMMRWSKIFRVPSVAQLKPILFGGVGVQMRAIALNIAFLAVTKTTQALDTDGTAAAAHAVTIQLWQLGGVVLLAMSTVASIVVPAELAKAKKCGKKGLDAAMPAKFAAERMLSWGMLLGALLSVLQLAALPLLGVFTPLKGVQEAARIPSMIGAALQLINGVVFIGEGIQTGNQAFTSLAGTTAIATIGMLTSLKLFGSSLIGVWGSFAVFNGIRLMGVLRHTIWDAPWGRIARAKGEAAANKSQ